MKIIFMGTPEFAIPSLGEIYKKGWDIISVVTQPDRPKGRGMHSLPSPVKEFALKHGIKILEPLKVRDKEFINLLKDLGPDIIVVVAYGKILPKEILEIPPLGCVNLHASLLPKYRGAAPINWTIINGEKETGVTTQMIAEKMDAGNILLQERMKILESDTAGTLHDKLKVIGAFLLINTLEGLKEKSLKPIVQDESKATYAPILKKEDGLIDWIKKADSIINLIRGTNPWPSAYTFLSGKLFKIWKASLTGLDTGKEPGSIIKEGDKLFVQTGDRVISLEEVQMENHKRMPVKNFLMGRDVPPSFDLTKKIL